MAQNLHNSERLPAVIIVLQFVGHSPGRYLILSWFHLSYCLIEAYSLSSGMWYLFLGWVPGSSCKWLLNSQLWFQWSCRKGRGHILLLHYLEPIWSLISLQQMIFWNWQYSKFLVCYIIQECMSLTIGFCLSKTILHLCLRKVISPKSYLHIFFPESI